MSTAQHYFNSECYFVLPKDFKSTRIKFFLNPQPSDGSKTTVNFNTVQLLRFGIRKLTYFGLVERPFELPLAQTMTQMV